MPKTSRPFGVLSTPFDEMYAERVEFGQGVHELPQGPCESVIAINEHGVESAPLGIGEQPIERGTRLLAARDAAIDEFLDDIGTTL